MSLLCVGGYHQEKRVSIIKGVKERVVFLKQKSVTKEKEKGGAGIEKC